jgi:hypothetical protein
MQAKVVERLRETKSRTETNGSADLPGSPNAANHLVRWRTR